MSGLDQLWFAIVLVSGGFLLALLLIAIAFTYRPRQRRCMRHLDQIRDEVKRGPRDVHSGR